ncbi:glycosyltransferase [Sulfurovum sp. XTW-4]|uniref:Glycosyltransferase n=1 Tax=Sulfurovum xiamenensis TaxID=3019066 RepID=A0ABT7QQA3_9BACT|nr:glycosyltransferase [Sulfurovum xiamenensis]MDM5262927.1 glycosyltransferase [Sulfurovum xiamenensis]
MFKKLKYSIENLLYKFQFGSELELKNFKFKANNFSGKKLNIIYLTQYDGSFSINNTYEPLKEFGTVFKFELDKDDDRKNWYQNKVQRNNEMLNFVDNTIRNHKIDVIVCYLSGFSTTPEVLKKIKSYNIFMINESLDDERKFISKKGKDGIYRGMKDICRFFDLSLTTSQSALVKYLVEGGKPMYKDYAGNEKIYKNLHLKKEYDVGFVGASYGIRDKYIQYLQDNGINVYAKGKGWQKGFAESDEMIEIFNKSKIVLGFSTVGKNDDIYILKGRDFEVPLTGSFYMTGHHEELKEYFDLGKDIETYNSKEDLLKKVKYYLENEEEREQIAKNGYEKCLKSYTVKKAYEKVFGYLGL